jgi:hypothetical protein
MSDSIAQELDLRPKMPLSHGSTEQPEALSGKKAERIQALDFTKGALVGIMVLYHWLNYFVGPQGFYYRYLRFLPPSFICITGFLISQAYFSKYQAADGRIPGRLVVRGAKLLAIFVVLNSIIGWLSLESYNGRWAQGQSLSSKLKTIYLTGNFGHGKIAAFTILVPISYLLIMSACLLLVNKNYKYVFPIACLLFFASDLILGWNGFSSGNLDLVTIGLLGASLGCISIQKINSVFRYTYLLLFFYACYLLAITVWDVVYPLQILGVCLTLLLIYNVGLLGERPGRTRRLAILLGRYSLLSYILQIMILQMLHRVSRHNNWEEFGFWASLPLALVLMSLVVEAVDWSRTKSTVVNTMYQIVFS